MAGAAAATVPLRVSATARASRPNIIVIMADDMGYNGTSVYGGWIKTPNIEKLAAQGMKFTDFHSSGVVCSPTRAGLMTGRYQERAGIPGVVYAHPNRPEHYTGLQKSEITFPEQLETAGYTCALMGKWHLGYFKKYNPVHHGFDEFHGYVSGNVDYISHYDGSGAYDWWDGLELVEEEGYSTHLINRHALNFIDANKDGPFCLYVAHEAVHSPFQGPDSQIQRGPRAGERPGADNLSKQEAYVQMMTAMDDGVGEILDKVDELGLADNTLIFFFSDNGHAYLGPDSYKFPLRGKKGTVWEGGHRVPAIARWPGMIDAGTSHNGLFISLDLMPTMLELADTPPPKGRKLDGTSMVDAMLKGADVGRRQLFWKGQAMRDGKWKMVTLPDGGLYDLSTDLAEQNDLTERFPKRAAAMKADIERWKLDVADGATPQPDPPQDIDIGDKSK